MSKYEAFTELTKCCATLSQLYQKKGETNLAIFYHNASAGYEIKRNRLTAKEAQEAVC